MASSRPEPLAVGVISLGCPKNLVDTEVMLGLLQRAGFAIVAQADQADVLIVNTCCFISAAREEAAQALAEAASLRAGRVRALICAGCWPQSDAAGLRSQFPQIDALMGPGDVPHVVTIVREALATGGRSRPQSAPSAYLYDDTTPRLRATAPWTAYIKIAEGCNHRCRFCVIPRLRGRYRSRPLSSIVREARSLAADGVREVNLVAQDTTAYGRDLDSSDIADLLAELTGIADLRWIRLLYAFPGRIAARLLDTMARSPSICHYLDLPFQHADRGVLKHMGRPGDGDSYLGLVSRARAAMPDLAIRSTFLVGFPGENDSSFQRLLDFLEAAQLDRVGAFCYSPEPGTAAAQMPDQVPAEVARQRYHELMARQQAISLARNRLWVGRTLDVLVESRGERVGEWIGRSFRDAPEIDGSVILTSTRPLHLGRFVKATVTSAEPYDLTATAQPDAGQARRAPAP